MFIVRTGEKIYLRKHEANKNRLWKVKNPNLKWFSFVDKSHIIAFSEQLKQNKQLDNGDLIVVSYDEAC